MAAINGISTNMALDFGTTWGTAVAVGTDDKMVAAVDISDTAPALGKSAVGSGSLWTSTAPERGTQTFGGTINFTGGQSEEALAPGYENSFDKLVAHFFGTTAAPVEQTVSQGDMLHVISFNTTLNSTYLTLAYEETSTTVAEFPSIAATSWNFVAENPTAYCSSSFDVIADSIASSPTNNNAAVQAATIGDTECITVHDDDEFLINTASGGALTSPTDRLNITSYNLTLTKPQVQSAEIKGAVGLGAPILTNQYTGELTITLKELADATVTDYWANETVLKSSLVVDGTQIGTGVNKSFSIFLPAMKVVNRPNYTPTDPGTNPATVTFKLFGATAAPTGFNAVGTAPYVELINTRSTQYIT